MKRIGAMGGDGEYWGGLGRYRGGGEYGGWGGGLGALWEAEWERMEDGGRWRG